MARKRSRRNYGSGNIIELDGGLAIRWRETVLTADGPKRVMRYKNLGAVSRTEAGVQLAERMRTSKDAGPRVEAVIPTFGEIAERYKRDILPLSKFSTRALRGGVLDHHLEPRFGKVPVDGINAAAVQRFMTELRETGFERNGVREEYSSYSLHDVRAVMRDVMRYSNDWYRLPCDPATGQPFNPAVSVKMPALKRKREAWALTADQAGRLIGRLKGKARVMVAIAITCGLRRGELLALRLRHLAVKVDAAGNRYAEIDVKEASYLGHIDTPKTEAGARKVEVHSWVLGLINDWLGLARKRKPDDLIFGTRSNKLENSNNVLRRSIYPACKAIGVPNASWLTFRRTFQTLAHNAGVSARTIADIVGHVDVETQFIYVQPVRDLQKAATQLIEEKLCKVVQEVEREASTIH